MNYRHTEPKLCHRRRQIETPTVFNNVEEIPGAKEKFLSSPPQTREARVLTELNGGGQSCYAQRRHWPTGSLSLTGPHHKFVKSRPPVAQAPGIYCLNWFSFNLWGEAPGTETLSLYGTRSGGSRTHTVTLIERCPVHFKSCTTVLSPSCHAMLTLTSLFVLQKKHRPEACQQKPASWKQGFVKSLQMKVVSCLNTEISKTIQSIPHSFMTFLLESVYSIAIH